MSFHRVSFQQAQRTGRKLSLSKCEVLRFDRLNDRFGWFSDLIAHHHIFGKSDYDFRANVDDRVICDIDREFCAIDNRKHDDDQRFCAIDNRKHDDDRRFYAIDNRKHDDDRRFCVIDRE
ncbi:MAG: hypothetical protein WCH34_05530, partial [Bacteroidota bacterium]